MARPRKNKKEETPTPSEDLSQGLSIDLSAYSEAPPPEETISDDCVS